MSSDLRWNTPAGGCRAIKDSKGMQTVNSHLPYESEIEVQPSDIDQLGHVNNVVYLKWTQDIATAHWYAFATEEQKATLFWVVLKHVIEYKRPAFNQDIVTARTWVGKATHRYFERHTDFHLASNGKLLAKVATLWIPVDSDTKKRVSVGPDVYEMFST